MIFTYMAYCLSGVWVKKLFLCKSFWHFFCDFFWYFALPKRHRKPVKRWRRAEKKKKEKEKRKPKKSIKPLETLFQGITLRWGFFYWNGKEEKKEKKKKPKEDQKEIGLVVLSALFFGNQMGMPSPAWFCLRFGVDAKMSNEFTKIMSKRGAKW